MVHEDHYLLRVNLIVEVAEILRYVERDEIGSSAVENLKTHQEGIEWNFVVDFVLTSAAEIEFEDWFVCFDLVEWQV